MHTTNSSPFFRPPAFLGSHFAPAFYFLTPERRHALKVLYAVFRVLDDTVDIEQKNPKETLESWRSFFETLDPAQLGKAGQRELGDEILLVIKKFDIPLFSFFDFISHGVGIDLECNRFETPMDTERYCYGVAGTVGIACLPIFGVPWQEAKDFAIRLGITVQWINAIRDVGVDASMGRIYLPLQHLQDFGCTEKDILDHRPTPAFQALIQHETDVARGHYRRALELLPKKWERELLPARVMGGIYCKLLAKIEKHDYPVLTKKISLNIFEKGIATWNVVRS